MDLDKSTSTSASLKKLQEDDALPGRGTMEREAGGTEPQPVLGRMVAIEDYILCGFLPPPSEFLLLVLNFYGLSLLHLNPNSIAFLSIFSHLCEAYIGVEPFLDLFRFYYELRWMESNRSFIDAIDDLRVRGLSGYEVAADFIGLNSETMERRVGQLMISGPTTASKVPVPLCEKGAAEREAAINALPLTDIIGPLVDHQAAASLKEDIAKEVSDVAAAAATTSGGNIPKRGRKFSSVIGNRRKTPTPSPVSIAAFHRAAWAKAAQDGSGGTSSVSPAVASTDVMVVPRSREATPSGPASDLAAGRGPAAAVLTWEELQVEMGCLLEAGAREVHEDLQKMRELVAGNERQRQGLERRMSELENNLSEIRGSLRVTYTGLHQLAGECGVRTTIPANPDEFSLTSSPAELSTAMEAIPSKHAARIGEETSNRIYTGACMSLRVDVDVEDVQQRGQPELPMIVPALAFEPYVPQGDVDQNSPVETGMATTSLDLESELPDQDRRIQYCRTKFEVAELERTMLEVKKDQAVETLRGRELQLEFLHKGFSRSRRTPTEIDGLAKSMAPLAEKVFQSMDWRWPSW
uniref:OSJNBa0011J08.23 protein n=1 Tax=Oryza sativa subsp. japonica TaxID=39947 RepID=Q7X7A5_ORYSJ|nr:OSJNBa0064M23.2 [Oryza sativa Japonica Group]CAE03268.1 OSJNBa0011J08.23 [Oryza sativa Japonica Group]